MAVNEQLLLEVLKEHVPGVTRVEQVGGGADAAEDLYDEYAPF